MSSTGPSERTLPLSKAHRLPKRKLSAQGLRAQRVVNKYTALAGGSGLIPVPLFGQLAVAGLLTKLLHDLCRIYGVSFSDHQIKITVAAILGGAHAEWINHYLMKYIRGYTPVSNAAGSLLLRPAISALLVYYIGKMFLGHFESGAWVRVKEQGLR
ncbi:hypothetical protein Q9L42_008725 [Methylomarinum sp. Ch1-1]|uniref:DUF697 domain-containing protein n=1 Tax=Methylomarinum roseum TaxID=3067653 RepID=A0AAU7NYZ0_9GAMM|nr:hypothetical protein [Methylomarinum sp. Ch1-1]MDP4521686.1 hypothetical protein [Methylomarinum sp. Ch1-1]